MMAKKDFRKSGDEIKRCDNVAQSLTPLFKRFLAWFAWGMIMLCLAGTATAGSATHQVCNESITASAPDSRYTLHGDGTATDKQTGLMWLQCSEGQSYVNGTCIGAANIFKWDEAIQRAASVGKNGPGAILDYNDWRLPEKDELFSLIERRCTDPSINATIFPNTESSDYWSSSPGARFQYEGWYVNFSNGNVYNDYEDNGAYVRLVRGGPYLGELDCTGTPNGPARRDNCGTCDSNPANDCVVAGKIPTNGLIGYWQGNGNANDSSPTGNNGVFSGNYVEGRNSGLAFDLSTGKVSIPDIPAYNFQQYNDGWSVGFWFNANGQLNGSNGTFLGQDISSGEYPKWFIDYGYGHSNAFEIHLNNWGSNPRVFLPSNNVILPTGWNQLTLVKDSSGFTFYLHGTSIGFSAYSGIIPDPSANFMFGALEPCCNYNGLMQDVVVYNRALTAQEVVMLAKNHEDCLGVIGGTATVDNCGTCDDDPTNDCQQDCLGNWGGPAKTDSCGICDADPANDCKKWIAIRHNRTHQADGTWSNYRGDFEAAIQISIAAQSVDLLLPNGGSIALNLSSDGTGWWNARDTGKELPAFDAIFGDGVYTFRVTLSGGNVITVPVDSRNIPMPGQYPELSGIDAEERWNAGTQLPLHWQPWTVDRAEPGDVMLFVNNESVQDINGQAAEYAVHIDNGVTDHTVPGWAISDNSLFRTWVHFANWDTNEVVKQTASHVHFQTGTQPATGSISGTISYNGTKTGPVFVSVFTDPLSCLGPNLIQRYRRIMLPAPGSYTIQNLPDGTYYISSGMRTEGADSAVLAIDPGRIFGDCNTEAQKLVISGGNALIEKNLTLLDFTPDNPNPLYQPPGNYSLADLEGVWELNGLAGSTAWWVRGPITVAADGSVSGGPVTEFNGNILDPAGMFGRLNISSQGLVTISDDPDTWCSMSLNKTLISCTSSRDDNVSTMAIFAKKAASYVLAMPSTKWEFNALASGPGAPFWKRSTIFVSGGLYSGTETTSNGSSQNISGTVPPMSADGVTINASWRKVMDAGKTITVRTGTWSGDTTQIEIATRMADSYSQADLVGAWKLNEISSGSINYWGWHRGAFTVKPDGSFSMAQTFNNRPFAKDAGLLNISTEGIVTSPNIPGFRCTMDASKTVLGCTRTESNGSTILSVITKASEPDCLGILGGTATRDNCGVCDEDPANDCKQDCLGVWGGTATFDACGVCLSANDPTRNASCTHCTASDTTCDGIDDDCNGHTDDGYVASPTTCGAGACSATGQTQCVNGQVINTCVAGTGAASDTTCDNIDNDCDGQIDEDFASTPTSCGVGACSATGHTQCVNGQVVDTCTPLVSIMSDSTCDGIDNDCNGYIDDGYVATPTSCGIGACSATGQTQCLNGFISTSCAPAQPGVEHCDGIDNDCDGQIDNGLNCTLQPDHVLINEVHYDQKSKEQEFIELYAPTANSGPVDLAGWRLSDMDEMEFVFANLPCPQPFTLALNPGDRLTVWQGNGQAVCVGPVKQIFMNRATFLQKNGDDIALVNATGNCVDYVAYELGWNLGAKIAPPADCAWSGPNPTNGNAAGVSISRFDAEPVADTDSGANWEASGATSTTGPMSSGARNDQTVPVPGPNPGSQILLNEIHYDQKSGEQEFIELYAPLANSGPVDLAGWRLKDMDEMDFVFANLPCPQPFILNPGDRLTVWHGPGQAVCSGANKQLFLNRTTFLQKAGDDVGLFDANGRCLDYVAYENATPAPAGCAWSGPKPSNGNVAGVSISRFDAEPIIDTSSSSDWEASGTTSTTGPLSPVARNVAAAGGGPGGGTISGSVLINEVHYDQDRGEQEFVELYAPAANPAPVDLTGWRLKDMDQVDFALTNPSCPQPVIMNPGDRLVVWQGIGQPVCTGPVKHLFMNRIDFFLQRDGDDLALLNAAGGCVDYVAYEQGWNQGGNIVPPPAGCVWSGPNPTNDNAVGVSISRFDAEPVIDTNSGGDWERSGGTATKGPKTPAAVNE